MKIHMTILFVLAFCLAAAADEVECRKAISGSPDYERLIDDTHAIPAGARLSVENLMGDVDVVAGEGKELRLQALIQVKGDGAEKFGEAIRVEVDGGSDPATIRTRYPDRKDTELSFGVSLKVWLPAGHDLTVRNSFGDIALANVRGEVAATAANGSIDVLCVVGPMSLDSTFGNVNVVDSAGRLMVAATSGSVKVMRHRKGDVEVRSKFGGVGIEDAAGTIRVECSSGNVAVLRAAGDVKVEVAFGQLTLKEIGGGVVAIGKSSNVTIGTVAKGAKVDCTFGSVKVGDLDGPCTIRSKSGNVSVNNIDGDLDVESRFGSIRVEGATGHVLLRSESGNVRAEDLSYARTAGGERVANRIDIATIFGMVDVSLPEPPSFRLDAAVTFGRIRSDFELTGMEKGLNSMKCACTLGEGEAEVRLRSKSGNISIAAD